MRKHGSELDMDVLGEMDVLHRNITEALRIHPPLLLVMRYAKQPFTVTTSKGRSYTVPAVRGLWVCACVGGSVADSRVCGGWSRIAG